MLEAIRSAGGEIYAITSEPQSLARNAQEDWNTDMEHVGDPHQEIAAACAERGWLSLFTSDWDSGQFGVGKIPWTSHPKGYFQPGVLALTREERVLYRWRCRPSRKNVGGAISRPTADHVWNRVSTSLEAPEGAGDAEFDEDPALDVANIPWPFFVALLLANGWFLKAEPFDQRSGEDTVWKRQRNALIRMPLFALAWIVAALLLPTWVVALAFTVWVAKVWPEIRSVNAAFQNVGPDEEPA